MNQANQNPNMYIKVNAGDFDSIEVASNFDWLRERAVKDAEILHGEQVIYKLVPVFKAQLKVTTEVVQVDIAAVQSQSQP